MVLASTSKVYISGTAAATATMTMPAKAVKIEKFNNLKTYSNKLNVWIGNGTQHMEIPKCNKDQRTELEEFRIKTLNDSAERALAFGSVVIVCRTTALIRRSVEKCGKFNFGLQVISLKKLR